MIDWISAKLPCLHHPLKTGSVIKLTPEGEIEWASPSAFNLAGSYESNYQITSCGSNGQGRATHLSVTGNPSKFLQGHNIFGSDDIVSLMRDFYLMMTKSMGLTHTDAELEDITQGNYQITRVDIT